LNCGLEFHKRLLLLYLLLQRFAKSAM